MTENNEYRTAQDKVTFTRLETTDDGMGGVTTEDKTICTEWAFVTVPSTRDGVVAAQMRNIAPRGQGASKRHNARNRHQRQGDLA